MYEVVIIHKSLTNNIIRLNVIPFYLKDAIINVVVT